MQNILQKYHFHAIGEQNGKIKQLKGIIQNSKPNPNHLFFCEGIWQLSLCEKLNTPIDSLFICIELIKTEQAKTLIGKLAMRAENLFTISKKTAEKITERGQIDGLMAIAQLPQHTLHTFQPAKNAVILVLDGLEIPGNVGTILRLADGAAIDAVFLCNKKVRLTHPKLIKGSQGAILSVPLFQFESVQMCIQWLQKKNFTIYLADTRAEKYYYQEPFGKKTAIVLGAERYGISKEWYTTAHIKIAIPMLGNCDSLNVGVAATILAYEATKKNKFLTKN